jgi:pimeloyl-ACP methyl ester carboxylesterase
MDRLGYARYGAHGGDWGAMIARELGRTGSLRGPLAGVHLTMLSSAVATQPPEDADGVPPDEIAARRASYERRARFMADEFGYGMLQATRPQTLAYALTDSPVGQLAWIVEKFKAWTDTPDLPEDAVDRDQLLTNVTVYWLTATANSSARLYYETSHSKPGWALVAEPSSAPTGVAVFPQDTSLPVRSLAERTNHIVRWSEMPKGGHFPAMEVPDALVAEIRTFFGTLA